MPFYLISDSEFLVLTHSIPGIIVSGKEIAKECDVFGAYSNGNLPVLGMDHRYK